MGIDENVRELRMLIIFLGLGKNGPGKNGPGKNSPGKNGPGDYWIIVESVKTVRSFR